MHYLCRMAGIYIHIPFCKQKCSYCNFHFSVSMKTKDGLIKAILKEIELNRHYLKNKIIDSVYIGGGTPSLLSAMEIDRILNKINKYFIYNKNIEITLEANPDDVNNKYLLELKSAGINRFSMGVQSFHNNELILLNRSHDSYKAVQSLTLIKEAGFENTNIDLIFGIPGSSLDDWKKNLDIFLKTDIPHLSCYNLTIEPKTILAYRIKTGKLDTVNDDLSAQMFSYTHKLLTKNNFEHYEISNYAIAGKHALHNTNYWLREPYLGLGPSAHSFNGNSRQWNIANNRKYIESINNNKIPKTIEILTPQDKYNEYIMTGMRTMWGVNIIKIRDLGDNFFRHFNTNIPLFIKDGMIIRNNNEYVLSEKGLLYADRISSELFY